MAVPVLVPTGIRDETAGGVSYHIEGELVPVLHIEMSGVPVYFEHHILLWKDPVVDIGIRPLQGAFRRVLCGMPIFLTEARGTGRIAFSRDGVGHVFAIHLQPGEALDVREHQFLAATHYVGYSFTRVRGVANILFGGTGFFIDTFYAQQYEGVLWVHGYGNVFEVTLGPGESIDLEPGAWVYKDRTVQMETIPMRLASGLFASGGQIFWNRFTGPGRVGLQSMYIHYGASE
jgi:uncharacterized protein (AIM24 family)